MDKLTEWFSGDKSALELYERLVYIAHAWDDLIDKDKPVGEDKINGLVLNLLLYLPTNQFFRRFESELRTLLMCGAASYLAANLMERSGDEQRIEIAHYLRYAVSQTVVFMIVAINGMDRAPAIVAEAMPLMIPERLTDYMKEHAK